MGEQRQPEGPDLGEGIPLESLGEGRPVAGHREGEAVLVIRLGDEVHAVGGTCTHYGGPLAEGLVVEGTVRCPWHHACFSLRSGEALAAPALNPLPRWEVEVREGTVIVGRKLEQDPLAANGREAEAEGPMVIVGAGAAGSAAAEMLRREGYGGEVIMIDPDPDAPYDRPNLSKDYLAGSAPEEWIPLRPEGFYDERKIRRVVDHVVAVDRKGRRVRLSSGDTVPYGRLLIATGATPRRLPVPGGDLPHVLVLRSLGDSRRLIAAATAAKRAVVIGAGFIGMEAAAALRGRGLEVTVVAPEEVPFGRVLGPDLGAVLWRAHEENGVEFRLGQTVSTIRRDAVVLDDGSELKADLVLAGVGVTPDTALAEAAGLRVDGGIVVDALLRTSDDRILAAGDNARWPDPRTGRPIRVEHWVVAQRQGQAAARTMLGRNEPYRDVPFFWTAQFGVTVSYVGHAGAFDRVEIDGSPERGDASYRYVEAGRVLAVATIGRDRESLEMEAAMFAEAANPVAGRIG